MIHTGELAQQIWLIDFKLEESIIYQIVEFLGYTSED